MSSSTVTPAGEALRDLFVEVAFLYFQLLATERGVTPRRGITLGELSILRSLEREGPQTVPEIARARPVPRQPVQRMANRLAQRKLIEFVANPRHARSKLLRITPKGSRLFQQVHRLQAVWASRLAGDELSAGRVRQALRLVQRLRALLRDRRLGASLPATHRRTRIPHEETT